jgi:hypothetical protein
MANFTENVVLYKSLDVDGKLSVDQISEALGWDRNTSYIFKFFISELTWVELSVLDNVQMQVDLEIVKAISLLQTVNRSYVFNHIERILESPSPFKAIDTCLEESKGVDPLGDIRPKYWTCIGGYLRERKIDQFPFNKNAINFIFSIGYIGYESLSAKQKIWLNNLIAKDKERPENDRFFVNEHAYNKGFSLECSIIQKL